MFDQPLPVKQAYELRLAAQARAAEPRPPRERAGLFLAHRLGTLSLLCLIIALAMLGRMPFYWHLLPAGFLLGLAGGLGGFLAWFFARRRGGHPAEPRNAAIFCGTLTSINLIILILVRLEVIAP